MVSDHFAVKLDATHFSPKTTAMALFCPFGDVYTAGDTLSRDFYYAGERGHRTPHDKRTMPFHLGCKTQGEDDLPLAVLLDNPAAISCLLNESVSMESSKSADEIIKEKNLFLLALWSGSVNSVNYFLKKHTIHLESKTKISMADGNNVLVTPLAIVVGAMSHAIAGREKLDENSAFKLIKILITAGANPRCKVK